MSREQCKKLWERRFCRIKRRRKSDRRDSLSPRSGAFEYLGGEKFHFFLESQKTFPWAVVASFRFSMVRIPKYMPVTDSSAQQASGVNSILHSSDPPNTSRVERVLRKYEKQTFARSLDFIFPFSSFQNEKVLQDVKNEKSKKILGRSSYSLKSRANKMGPIKPINSLHFSRYIA